MNFFKRKLLKELSLIAVTLGILQLLVEKYDLYWTVNEFDSLMHFLGGVAVAIAFIFLYYFSDIFDPPEKTFFGFLYIAFLGAILISVSWEIVEFVYGEAYIYGTRYLSDTLTDLLMDGLGALSACLYAFGTEVSRERREVGVLSEELRNE